MTDETNGPTSSDAETLGPGSSDWPHRLEALAAEEPSPRRTELRRLADATRRVLHGMVMTDADTSTLADAADALEGVAEVFADPSRRSIFEGFNEAANSGDPHGFFDHSPMLGRANPIAPPVELWVEDERSMGGTATFGAAYEGPPGCVHGGYIAAAFDEVLGAAQSLSGQPGMTGQLTVTYRSPTPLHEPLRFVGSFEGTEGRKIFTRGSLHVGNRLCAEAEGVFISVDFTRFAELREKRARREAERSARGTGPADGPSPPDA